VVSLEAMNVALAQSETKTGFWMICTFLGLAAKGNPQELEKEEIAE
jgi:hypothetical protein